MEDLSKTIKKLSEEDYKILLEEVSGKKKNKPFVVLEALRNEEIDDSELMERLEVNRSTYYTLKSRLNTKVASILAKQVNNPISALKEEVARVSANLYGNNKIFSIRALKELEKQLIEYDLSNELIIVYKTLARLHQYTDEFKEYEQLYNKHVAFSLAVVKVEDLFYDFIRKIGKWYLTRNEEDLELVRGVLREMINILELYNSHRMFVMYNIVRIYYHCSDPSKREGLHLMEIEIETTLNQINTIFEKYTLDTFYQNIKSLTDFLLFEYYQKTNNMIRADHNHQKLIGQVPDLASKHIMAFHVVQFLNSKIEKFLGDGDLTKLLMLNKVLEENLEIDPNEAFHFYSWKRYLAVCRFYQSDYSGAAKIINVLRNNVNLKQFIYADVECKLFQALQYCIIGEEGLCQQIIQSIKRQMKEGEKDYEDVELYIKLMKTAMKPADFRKKMKKLTEIWKQIVELNVSHSSILWYVRLDESMMRRMGNPIK